MTVTPETFSALADPSRFVTDMALLRPATRQAYEAYKTAYDCVAQRENAMSLDECVYRLCFVENPLDVLDLLRADEESRLIRDTVMVFDDDSNLTSEVALFCLELAGWDWSILVVVGPEAQGVIDPYLRSIDGGQTVFGGVERFAL